MKITVKDLDQTFELTGSVNEVIKFAQSKYPVYPTNPSKPYLKSNANPTEIRKHADDVEDYETKKAEYVLAKGNYSTDTNEINKNLEDWIKNHAGLLNIPTKSQDKVWNKAWEDGHSDGYYEVYNKLMDLIDLFE